MSEKRTRQVNDRGIGFTGIKTERMRDIRVYDESGSVQVWVDTPDDTVMQYLTPEEAMAFAKAFERCAIAALKEHA